MCQESLNEAPVAFATRDRSDWAESVPVLGTVRGVRGLCWLWTAPASCCHAWALHCSHTHRNVQFLLLFYFGLEEERREQTIWASKVSVESRDHFSCSPIEVCRKDLKQMIFFPFFFFLILFPVFLLKIVRCQGNTRSLVQQRLRMSEMLCFAAVNALL